MTAFAAGVLYVADDGACLMMKRGNGGDHPGEWAFPGGSLEEGEDAKDAALREWKEETGVDLDLPVKLWARRREKDQRLPFGYSEALEHVPQPGGDPVGPGQVPNEAQQVAEKEPPAAGDLLEDVDFTTFICRGGKPFIPELCDESTGYAWVNPSEPPEPLHPGCRIALAKLTFNELDIAKAMAAGELTSPQHYENVALFDMRITGTGTAYRKRLNELAYRAPENYLTDEFLARCNGLPVIVEHPENRSMLDTKEYQERNVGAIFLPYIKGDEVWGIAKIHDMPAAEMMEANQLSTSPSVVFRDPNVNTKVKLEEGLTLLIEGKPSLLDHLAICEQGVWDKDGPPVGVVRGDSVMSEEERLAKEREDKSRKDAEEKQGQTLDKMLSCLDSIGKRLDAVEEYMDKRGRKDDDDDDDRKDSKRKDGDEEERRRDSLKARKDAGEKLTEEEERELVGKPKEVVADKKGRKDDDDDDDDDDRKDAKRGRKDDDDDDRKDARHDSAEIGRIVADAVRSALPKPMTDEEYDQMLGAQARADQVYAMFGDAAPRPLSGEGLMAYRRRLVSKLQPKSAKWKDAKLSVLSDEQTFSAVEADIYNDAQVAARSPSDLPAGTLRMLSKSSGGHEIHDWVGDPADWMGKFAGPTRQHVTKFNTNVGGN